MIFSKRARRKSIFGCPCPTAGVRISDMKNVNLKRSLPAAHEQALRREGLSR